jgi:hypothetical protein
MRSDIKLSDITGRWRLYDLEKHQFPDNKILEYHIFPDGKFHKYSGSSEAQASEMSRGKITITPKNLEHEADTVSISFGNEHYDAWDEPDNKIWHLEKDGERFCFKRVK